MSTRPRPARTSTTISTAQRLRVSGRIADRQNAPIAGAVVVAFDQDLRSTQQLGEGRTSTTGRYEITYTRESFARAEKDAADVFIEVRDRGGKSGASARSPVRFNAPQDVVIDLVVADGFFAGAEYTRLTRDVTGLAAPQKVSIADLEQTDENPDVTFLSAELATPADRVVYLIVAHRLERKSEIASEFFYALLRTDALLTFSRARLHATRFSVGLDADPADVLVDIALLPTDTTTEAVDAAIAGRIVEPDLRERLPGILRRLAKLKPKAQKADATRAAAAIDNVVGRAFDGGAFPKLSAALSNDYLGNFPFLVEQVQGALSSRSAEVSDATHAALAAVSGFIAKETLPQGIKNHPGVNTKGDERALAGRDVKAWHAILTRAAEAGALADLVMQHPALDIRTVNVGTFMRDEKVAAKTSPKEHEAIASALRATQRLARLTTSAADAEVLLEKGFRSARAVAALTRAQFVARVGGKGGLTKNAAQAIHDRAQRIHTGSVLLAGEMKSLAGSLDADAVRRTINEDTITAWKTDFPNLKSLFELQDMCECLDCRSVFGPAAYLADALQFLKERMVIDTTLVGPPSTAAKDALFTRRPDLGDIDLNCDNALTPIPFIDIINELLESLAAPDPGFAYAGPAAAGVAPAQLQQAIAAQGLPLGDDPIVSGPGASGAFMLRAKEAVYKLTPTVPGTFNVVRTRQTHGTADERAAAPEYVNAAAYGLLATTRIAFDLPFDAAQAETAAIFRKLEASRADLMRAIAQGGAPGDLAIAAEEIGLSRLIADIISTADPSQATQDEFWNAGAGLSVATFKIVSAFLDRTGLAFAELETLLEQPFVNPTNALFIKHLDLSCDTSQMEIAALDLAALDRMHRFIRFWRATGLSQSDVNHAIRFDPMVQGPLDSTAFIRTGQVFRLARRTQRPVGELLWLYGPGPDLWDDAVYRSTFANPVNGAASTLLARAVVVASEALAPGARPLLATLSGPLALSLARTPAEIDALRGLLPNDELTFANLGRLYGLSAVARLASLSINAFLALHRLCSVDPVASPSATWDFLDIASALSSVGIDPLAIEALLTVSAAAPDARIPSDDAVTVLLQKLQTALAAARIASQPAFDATATPAVNAPPLLDLLDVLGDLDAATIAKIELLTRGRWNDLTETVPAFLDRVLGPLFPVAVVTGIKTAWAAIPGGDPDLKTAERNTFIDAMGTASADLKYDRDRRAAIVNALVTGLKLDEQIVGAMLDGAHLKAVVAVAALQLGDVIADAALITPISALPAVTPVAFPDAYAAVKLVAVMGIATVLLRLDHRRAAWLLAMPVAGGFLELDRLPYVSTAPAAPFAPLLRWARARRLDDTYPSADNPLVPGSLVSLLDAIASAAAPGANLGLVRASLAVVTGWDTTVLTDLTTRFAFVVADLADLIKLTRLEAALTQLKQVGVSVADGVLIAKEVLALSDAEVARSALRVRYDPSDWLTVRKSIENGLRELRRDALIAYLTATDARFTSTLDLFDFLLSNVEMSACQPTSRIVHAHGTVQLFVERCLMGIEPTTVADTADDTGWARWDWMRNYRVWEANRRVFVYPENWIEPELRDDKSPFFVDLEQALAQGEITDLSAEDAMQGYLQQLDDVAFLEHLACYDDTLTGTLHVFARTKGGDPASYYYRRFLKEREWTPWETVDLDITADQLVPFIRNSRLCLAWPVFQEEVEPSTLTTPQTIPSSSGGGTAPPPNKRLNIKLAVSEYRQGKWLPKKLSKDGLVTADFQPDPPKPDIFRFIGADFGSAGFQIVVTQNSATGATDHYFGAFAITGCKGYPEPAAATSAFLSLQIFPHFKDTRILGNRPAEMGSDATNDFALRGLPILGWEQQLLANTPDGNAGVATTAVTGPSSATFKVTQAQQVTGLDNLLTLLVWLVGGLTGSKNFRDGGAPVSMGTLLPFFFEDRNRVYSIVPGWFGTSENANAPSTPISFTASDVIPLVDDVWTRLVSHFTATIGVGGTVEAYLQALFGDADFVSDLTKLFAMFQWTFGYRMDNAFHPLACLLRKTLNEKGIPGLLTREVQAATTGFDFDLPTSYSPTALVASPHPIENIDFRPEGAYAGYNWEVFFHAPFLMAVKLNKQQRFEDAVRWYHYIFDPTGSHGGTAPQKYWVTLPFFQRMDPDYAAQRIDDILHAVADDPTGLTLGPLGAAIEDWRDHPFLPHAIARSRTVAYQKTVLMHYIGNLIDWGDSLFRQETMESITQADQIYVLAAKLLGEQPRLIPPVVEPPDRSYNELEPHLDRFSDMLLDLENLVPDLSALPHGGAELPQPPGSLTSLYFCIPPNDKMLEYWSVVEDRRFKITHCRTIDGAERTLALFAPRIDPADLVRATAAGLSISSVVAGLGAPVPPYRFNVVAEKTVELIQELRTLGQELSQVLEKRDAEDLALLRGTLEIQLLDKITEMKQAQIKEAQEQHKALDRSVDAATARRTYYQTRQSVSDLETAALVLQGIAGVSQGVATGLSVAAGVVSLFPNINIGISGFGGSPTATVTSGSSNIAGGLSSFAGAAGSLAGALSTAGSMVATVAGYERRKEEWQFQGTNADNEITQLKQQIEVAKVRETVTAKDLENHKKQIDNAKSTDAFMHAKFTNRELFDWMAGEITAIYFQAYDLAFGLAKKAERCYQHELGTTDTYIQSGSWDSARKGLGSANRLMQQVRRMEAAYIEKNHRDYELVKNVSLALLDPVALLNLKADGHCTVTIPEALFDLDHAGHYMRRLKTVSLTVPCVVGPYTSVSCKLTLLANRYRRSAVPAPQYAEDAGQDARFVYNTGGIQSIATSQSQNDSGLFELNFKDDRYLPFEGCGAASTWLVEFGSKFRTFDPTTISDVILQLRYTARDGGSGLKTAAEGSLIATMNTIQNAISASPGMLRCIDLRHEVPEAWNRLRQTQTAQFTVTTDMLPFFASRQTPSLSDAWLVVKVKGNPAAFAFSLDGTALNANKDALVIGFCSTKLPNPLGVALDAPFTVTAVKASDLTEGYVIARYQLV